METHDIIVIGASMGGIGALRSIAAGLPKDLPAAVFIVQHQDSRSPGLLAQILDGAGPLRASTATDGEAIRFGEMRLPPPDHHLILDDGRMRVTLAPKVNRHRPAIDPLFRSAAAIYGGRVIGVVLTGNFDDGSAGLWAVKKAGGIAVVQDPADARFPEMPRNALKTVDVDHCVPLAAIPRLLADLAARPAGPSRRLPDERELPEPVYTCPDCGGPTHEVDVRDERQVRFRCLIGHQFSLGSMIEAHADEREAVLWKAVIVLEHEALLAERAAHRVSQGEPGSDEVKSWEKIAARARQQADVIRAMLVEGRDLIPGMN
jgi:two-component system chemotaxis response regulator CheB